LVLDCTNLGSAFQQRSDFAFGQPGEFSLFFRLVALVGLIILINGVGFCISRRRSFLMLCAGIANAIETGQHGRAFLFLINSFFSFSRHVCTTKTGESRLVVLLSGGVDTTRPPLSPGLFPAPEFPSMLQLILAAMRSALPKGRHHSGASTGLSDSLRTVEQQTMIDY
jgi:hypothetical protein